MVMNLEYINGVHLFFMDEIMENVLERAIIFTRWQNGTVGASKVSKIYLQKLVHSMGAIEIEFEYISFFFVKEKKKNCERGLKMLSNNA